jgi:predicted metal-dependent phosphoesterase TrpH
VPSIPPPSWRPPRAAPTLSRSPTTTRSGGARQARAFAAENPALGVEVIVGEEVSTLNGHLLGLFLAERVPPGLTAERTIELIHDQPGLAVAADPFHPLRGRAPGHRPVSRLVPDLPLDAIEVVNNAGVFSRWYDALAAVHNVEWGLPVTAGSDAHDVWYLGSAVTRFEGRTSHALRRELVGGRTRTEVRWTWTMDKLPRHLGIQFRSLVRFLMMCRRPGLLSPAR